MPPRKPQRSDLKARFSGPLLCLSALASTGAVALTIGATSSDWVIATGFDRAFAALALPAGGAHHRFDGVTGSEDDWLRTAANDRIVKAVSVGQQIILSNNGTERHLVITDVRDAGEAETHIDTAKTSARALLITCREGAGGREIRLRLQAGQISEAAADPVPSTL